MKFAINYSPQSLQLFRAGQIQVDLFKLPPWDNLRPVIRQLPAAYIHFENVAGGGRCAEIDIKRAQRWLDETDTAVVNTHLAVSAAEFAKGEPISPESVIEKALVYVDYLTSHFGGERVVVENLRYPTPDWDHGVLAEMVDPAVITEIVRRSGCGLLLDVAHAVLAGEGSGREDVKSYLNELPVDALREVHVVGILPNRNRYGLREDHFAMTADDWSLAEWVVGQIRDGRWRAPDIMAFEYGGVGERFAWRSDLEVIATQTPRLYQLARSAQRQPARPSSTP